MDAVSQFWHTHHDLCINIVAGLIVAVLLWLIGKFWSRIIALLRQWLSLPAPGPPQQIVVNIPPLLQPIPSPPAEKPAAEPSSHPAPGAFLPRPPAVGFVYRQDRQGRDFVALLKGELAPSKRQFVVLSGSGGVGKSALASEAARQLEGAFAGRVIWSTADGRADYSLSGLLDEMASRLGNQDARKLAMEPKKQRVGELLAAGCTLVVLDNFETIPPAEQELCAQWLAHDAPCAVLVTSREGIEGAHNISTDPMLSKEAEEFLARLIAQAAHPAAFEDLDRARIMTAAEAVPLLMEWVVGQIDLAQDPEQVLTDLKKGKGTAAQRIFDRSFNLPQVGEDGRAALLALALFAPDASREALAEVAGFGRELHRLNEAVRHLAALRLVSSTLAAKRLMIEGLTREMASAHLAESRRQLEFRERFIDFFKGYAVQHAETKAEDFQALESEKENLLRTMAEAWDLHRWNDEMSNRFSLEEYLDLRGYWKEAIRTGELALRAARNVESQLAIAPLTHNLAIAYHRKGELARSEQLYQESLEIAKKLGHQSDIAKSLHQLAMLAQDQGNPEEARRLYQESVEIRKKLGDQSGIASSLGQLGRLSEKEGDARKAAGYYREALRIFEALHSPYTEMARRDLARVEGEKSGGSEGNKDG